eukprot:6186555-Pleurochrysis_carterae.AAC.3
MGSHLRLGQGYNFGTSGVSRVRGVLGDGGTAENGRSSFRAGTGSGGARARGISGAAGTYAGGIG